MKKKVYILLAIIIAMPALSGCCISHDWKEATCTTPKTCVKCQKTEGEALGHTWAEPTCIAPKTCIVCNETEGEALGHTWKEATCTTAKTCEVCSVTDGEPLGHDWSPANYQEPKICGHCAITEGEPLAPSFEEHGLIINTELDVTYDYVTMCYSDNSILTTGHATFSNFEIFETKPESGLEKKEGYEWRTVHVSILFDDENAYTYGVSVGQCRENYYDIEGWDASSQYDETTKRTHFVVNYYGNDYDCVYYGYGGFGEWTDNTITYDADYFIQVPVGYDGFVICLRNKGVAWEEGQHIYDIADDTTLFFRFK